MLLGKGKLSTKNPRDFRTIQVKKEKLLTFSSSQCDLMAKSIATDENFTSVAIGFPIRSTDRLVFLCEKRN